MTTALDRARPVATSFDVERVRRDFPFLEVEVKGRPLVYLDSAASAQKPRQVLDAIQALYERSYANVHRGVHLLAARATDAYEAARTRMARFVNAAEPEEVVFVRGTTEGINLVAQSWARPRLSAGDEILLSEMGHHSNIVPWQLVAEQTGAKIVVAPIDDRGEIVLEAFESRLNEGTKVVAFGHVSNALGTINPVRRMTELAHTAGAIVVVDGAQAAPHLRVDVEELGCDFYALSGHKMYGPSGIGILWGHHERLEEMPPYQGGGEMIERVSFEETTFAPPPARFEAGTPNIGGAVGIAAAADYLESLGHEAIEAHEHDLLEYATGQLGAIDGLRFIGTAAHKASLISFLLGSVHAHDVGTILDTEGIAVRAGHHCAQPAMDHFGVPGTARASFGVYNTRAEVDRLIVGLHRVLEVFA